MNSSINFFNEDNDYSLENEKKVKDWICKSIENESYIPGDLNFIFCSDPYLLKINQDYLDHNYYTDIITFDYKEDKNVNGDIFISIDRVKENSQDLNVPFVDELHRVMIHGVLHIISYRDKTPEEEKLMRSKEDFYLSLRTF